MADSRHAAEILHHSTVDQIGLTGFSRSLALMTRRLRYHRHPTASPDRRGRQRQTQQLQVLLEPGAACCRHLAFPGLLIFSPRDENKEGKELRLTGLDAFVSARSVNRETSVKRMLEIEMRK